MATHSSTLAWRIPWTEEPGGLQSMGLQRVGHNWATSLTHSLTPVDRSSKLKINKEAQVLNDTLDEMDLIDIFRAYLPNAEEYTFFSSAHGTFSRIDHILGYKSNLSKFKKIEIISSIFSDHSAMRLDINYKKKKTVRNTNTWRLNNMFLNNEQLTEVIGRRQWQPTPVLLPGKSHGWWSLVGCSPWGR